MPIRANKKKLTGTFLFAPLPVVIACLLLAPRIGDDTTTPNENGVSITSIGGGEGTRHTVDRPIGTHRGGHRFKTHLGFAPLLGLRTNIGSGNPILSPVENTFDDGSSPNGSGDSSGSNGRSDYAWNTFGPGIAGGGSSSGGTSGGGDKGGSGNIGGSNPGSGGGSNSGPGGGGSSSGSSSGGGSNPGSGGGSNPASGGSNPGSGGGSNPGSSGGGSNPGSGGGSNPGSGGDGSGTNPTNGSDNSCQNPTLCDPQSSDPPPRVDVPEPAAILLFGSGLAATPVSRRRRKQH